MSLQQTYSETSAGRKNELSEENTGRTASYEFVLANPLASEQEPISFEQPSNPHHLNKIKFSTRSNGNKSLSQSGMKLQNNVPVTETNVDDTEIDDDSNLYEIVAPQSHGETDCPKESNLANSSKQNHNTCNSLQSSSDVRDSTYSKLDL